MSIRILQSVGILGLVFALQNASAAEKRCEIFLTDFTNTMVKAGIGINNINNSFENFSPNDPSQEKAKDMAQKLVEYDGEDSIGLFLEGGTGVGKTHMAVATARAVADKQKIPLLYITNDNIDGLFFGPDYQTVDARAYLGKFEVIIFDGLLEQKSFDGETLRMNKWFEEAVELANLTGGKKILVTSRYSLAKVIGNIFNYSDGTRKAAFEDKAGSIFMTSTVLKGQSLRPKASWYK